MRIYTCRHFEGGETDPLMLQQSTTEKDEAMAQKDAKIAELEKTLQVPVLGRCQRLLQPPYLHALPTCVHPAIHALRASLHR